MSPSALGHGLAAPPMAARRGYCVRTTQGVSAGCPHFSGRPTPVQTSFFWEMEAGKCFCIGSRAYPVGPYMFPYRVTEVMATVSFAFCVKVINEPESKPTRSFSFYVGVTDNSESKCVFSFVLYVEVTSVPESKPILLQIRGDAALNGVDDVEASDCKEGFEVSETAKGGPLNPNFGEYFRGGHLENPYLTEAYDLDYPKGRGPDANKGAILISAGKLSEANVCGKGFYSACTPIIPKGTVYSNHC